MSELRMRKAPVVGGDTGSRPRGLLAKASGDTVPCNVVPKQQNQRSRSKNKIPKSIRYDLEKALVSLCDLWFEDIKPHLVKNNIKLHVHEADGGPGPASGDYGRVASAAGAPGCSHLDPGAASDVRALLQLAFHQRRRSDASFADCYSTLGTASRVQCPKPRTRQRRPSTPSLAPPRPSSLQVSLPHATPSSNGGCNVKPKLRSRRKSQQPQASPQPQSNWRVPRLCRTSSILPPSCISRNRMSRAHTALQPQHLFVPRDGEYFIQPKHRVKMKHKSTQTESFFRSSGLVAATRSTSPMLFGRCPGTTTIPPRRKSPEGNFQQSRSNSKPLFPKDLVNIIAAKHDKNLRLLYRSPQREDSPSVMNLFQNSDERSKELASVGKRKPWR